VRESVKVVGKNLKSKSRILGTLLLFAAVGSSAMTLGRVRGVALIGQPLDVSIPVQFEAEENASSLCMEADVFHADTRQDAARVKVSVESAPQPQTATVRVTSAQPVDEPMVTVYLKAGCGQKITRRYVLLADFPSEAAPGPVAASTASGVNSAQPVQGASVAAVEPKIGATWAEASKPAAPVAKAREPVAAKPIVRKVKPAAAAPVKANEVAPEKAAMLEKRQAGQAAGQSRLRLDPLEVLAERVTSLEAAKAAASAPAPATDIVKDAMRFQSLEGDVKALLALAAKNEASLADMRTRLQKAESERFANWLVYALFAAVLLCLAAVWSLWNRQKAIRAASGDWWRGGGDAAPEKTNVVPAPEPEAPVVPETTAATLSVFDRNAQSAGAAPFPPPSKVHAPVSTVDLHLSEVSASTFDTLLQSGPSSIRGSRPGALSRASGPGVRHINSEEIFDIRQQAEFFVSLGQTDQAIRVLERHIAENAGSSPSLYLELLQLFHSLNLKTDYRQFREDFNLLFNSRVPEFAMFKQEGRRLEAYPDVLADISALWTSPQVLQLLEACIFQNAWDVNGQTFDLAAFRELLLLYAVAENEHPVSTRPESSGHTGYTPMPPVRTGIRSGFGDVPKFGQDTDLNTNLDAYPTRSEELPSIYSDVDLDLDIDLDAVDAARQRQTPRKPG